jgi:lipopolysaccharide/colanic/teichoic acid biosynthesis glycosyltransferase
MANQAFIPAYFSYEQSSAAQQVDGVDILAAEKFVGIASKNDINSIVIVPGVGASAGSLVEFIRVIPQNIATFFVPTIHEVLLGVLGNLRVNDLPLIEVRLMQRSPVYDAFKRILDLFLAGAVLLTAALPMLLVALIVRITSQGPIFFSQARVGQNGRAFRIIKFRTMVYEPSRTSEFIPAGAKDFRITRAGKFLRATRLDELPQVFNVIKGDMSFVGPRPLVAPECEQFVLDIPAFSERNRIRPGITGLAQVSGNYETSAEIKLKYDLAYLSRRSLGLDFQIMLRTLKTVLTRAGQ